MNPAAQLARGENSPAYVAGMAAGLASFADYEVSRAMARTARDSDAPVYCPIPDVSDLHHASRTDYAAGFFFGLFGSPKPGILSFLDIDARSRADVAAIVEGLEANGWIVVEQGSERDQTGEPPADVGPYFVQAAGPDGTEDTGDAPSGIGAAVPPATMGPPTPCPVCGIAYMDCPCGGGPV